MLDALATRSIATTTTPGTYYPVGPVARGDAGTFDEVPINTGPIGQLLEFGVSVPSQVGTTPTLDVTWEFSDSAAFSTIVHTITSKQIAGASDTFPLRRRLHATTRATYARCKLVTAGTGAGFGTVTAWVSHPQTQLEQGAAGG